MNMNMNMFKINIFKMNKIKLFWMSVLLVIFLGYTYFYNYRGQEGFVIPGTELTKSLKRDMRITAESLNDNYGPESINHALTKLQYN